MRVRVQVRELGKDGRLCDARGTKRQRKKEAIQKQNQKITKNLERQRHPGIPASHILRSVTKTRPNFLRRIDLLIEEQYMPNVDFLSGMIATEVNMLGRFSNIIGARELLTWI